MLYYILLTSLVYPIDNKWRLGTNNDGDVNNDIIAHEAYMCQTQKCLGTNREVKLCTMGAGAEKEGMVMLI